MDWLAPPFSVHCLGAHVLSIEGKSAAAAGSNNVLQEGLGPGQGGDGLGDHVPDVQLMDHVQTQSQGRSFNTIHNKQSPFISLCRLWMNNIFYNIQRGFLKLYFSMNADKIADLERKIRKGPLPSTVNTINWLFSNQEFSIKPKQYHLSILTTRPRRCPQWLQTVSRWRAEERGDAGGEAGHLQGGQEAAPGQAEEHRHGHTLR